MATFEVKIRKIRAIEPIEGSDFIELAVIDDYRSVVKKGSYNAGDLAAYIPEAAIVPDWLLEKMGLTGKLAGKSKNRVKAAKFRGQISQGIVYGEGMQPVPLDPILQVVSIGGPTHILLMHEGVDVTEQLGIVKWEPEIPASMAGEVYNAGMNLTVAYDVENVKHFPDLFDDGEEVVYEEKTHGTFCGLAYLPASLHSVDHFKGKFLVFSKGLGAKGLCFKDTESNAGNVYIRALTKFDVFDKIETAVKQFLPDIDIDAPFFVLGEVFGSGIQDLTYGGQLQYRIFDVCQGYRGDQHYLDYNMKKIFVEQMMQLQLSPNLYRGPHSKAKMIEYTSGKEQISGTESHMREGIVIRPVKERQHEEIGRAMLKSVSEEYLLRKGEATEFS